ncbi:NucA/NucB deoxyribonuclease domain-containing protein [Paenibacillus bovis]|uniref:Sporulation protein n=1 Tax=Paenibacillus bovis TaxID=1616788 RepID=A0A172ZG02_9BACL|nr:sporulation protein [Paenibacillus bovis]
MKKVWMTVTMLVMMMTLPVVLQGEAQIHKVYAAAAYDYTLNFPSDRYPETADHIRDAIADGHSDVCTIDRTGADERREDSLRGVPTKSGYDRDEWPMAMCLEGGTGADIRYVIPSDNRGAGSWVGNRLENYPDGTKVKFIVN